MNILKGQRLIILARTSSYIYHQRYIKKYNTIYGIGKGWMK